VYKVKREVVEKSVEGETGSKTASTSDHKPRSVSRLTAQCPVFGTWCFV